LVTGVLTWALPMWRGCRVGCPLRCLAEATGRPSPRRRDAGPPLPGSTCPAESSPTGSRVIGSPPPPSPSGARGARTPGSFPVRRPDAPKSTGPSLGLRSPLRVSDRSLRPARGPAPPMRFLPRRRRHDRRSGSPGLASPGTFRPRGFDHLAGLLPATAADPEAGAVHGVHHSGLAPDDQRYPLPGPCPHAVSSAPCLLL
jgi:hypothetical protein